MKFENYTKSADVKKVKKIANFIGKYCKYNILATIRLLDAPEENKGIGGIAYQQCPDDSYDISAPSLIKIWITGNGKYPRQDSYVPEVVLTFHDFEEELLCVLAHEMRHIDQFWTSLRRVYGQEAEVDAEKFAARILELWRAQKIRTARIAAIQSGDMAIL